MQPHPMKQKIAM